MLVNFLLRLDSFKTPKPKNILGFLQNVSSFLSLVLEQIKKMDVINLYMLFAHGFCSNLEELMSPFIIKGIVQCARAKKANNNLQAGIPLTVTSFILQSIRKYSAFLRDD